jgi:hypothetical protein
VSVFPLLVIVHALAATVWTGGHLVLDLGVLPWRSLGLVGCLQGDDGRGHGAEAAGQIGF